MRRANPEAVAKIKKLIDGGVDLGIWMETATAEAAAVTAEQTAEAEAAAEVAAEEEAEEEAVEEEEAEKEEVKYETAEEEEAAEEEAAPSEAAAKKVAAEEAAEEEAADWQTPEEAAAADAAEEVAAAQLMAEAQVNCDLGTELTAVCAFIKPVKEAADAAHLTGDQMYREKRWAEVSPGAQDSALWYNANDSLTLSANLSGEMPDLPTGCYRAFSFVCYNGA